MYYTMKMVMTMPDRSEFNEDFEIIAATEEQIVVVNILMREGALRMQDLILQKLNSGGGCGDWAIEIVKAIDLDEISAAEPVDTDYDFEYDDEDVSK